VKTVITCCRCNSTLLQLSGAVEFTVTFFIILWSLSVFVNPNLSKFGGNRILTRHDKGDSQDWMFWFIARFQHCWNGQEFSHITDKFENHFACLFIFLLKGQLRCHHLASVDKSRISPGISEDLFAGHLIQKAMAKWLFHARCCTNASLKLVRNLHE